MTSRRLLILGFLAIVAITGALLLSRPHGASSTGDRDQLLYPQLKTQLDAVNAIRVFKAGDILIVEARRTGSDWTISDRAGYPADTEKVRTFLIATAAAQLIEQKTSNPANYAAIGVEDVKAAAATGHRVEIDGAAAPIHLIVGKQAAGSRTQYARRAADKESWLINASLDLPTTPDAWLRKDILDVSADRIQSANIAITDAKPYTAVKAARTDSDFTIDGLPKGKELSSPAAANGFGTALTSLTLTDVRKRQELEAQKPAAHATFRTFDGLIAEVDGWVHDNKRYIAVALSFDESLAQRFKVAVAPDAAAKPADQEGTAKSPAEATQQRDVAAEAKTQNAQLAGWAYEIPEYKYEAIFKPLAELLKK